jgi:hypothetical protein
MAANREALLAHGGTWTRLGSNLPNASVNDLRLSAEGSYLIAGTHGRGIWTIPTSVLTP